MGDGRFSAAIPQPVRLRHIQGTTEPKASRTGENSGTFKPQARRHFERSSVRGGPELDQGMDGNCKREQQS